MADSHALLTRIKQQEAALKVALFALQEINQGSAEPHQMLRTARIALGGIRDISSTALRFAAERGFHPESLADLTGDPR